MLVVVPIGTIRIVDIRLYIKQANPLIGLATVGESARELPFVGWLELLRLLAELIPNASHKLETAANTEFREDVSDVSLDRSP